MYERKIHVLRIISFQICYTNDSQVGIQEALRVHCNPPVGLKYLKKLKYFEEIFYSIFSEINLK